MDTRISIPIIIHIQFLPGFIIHGYPYPTQNPFNFFFLKSKNILIQKLPNNFILKKKKLMNNFEIKSIFF